MDKSGDSKSIHFDKSNDAFSNQLSVKHPASNNSVTLKKLLESTLPKFKEILLFDNYLCWRVLIEHDLISIEMKVDRPADHQSGRRKVVGVYTTSTENNTLSDQSERRKALEITNRHFQEQTNKSSSCLVISSNAKPLELYKEHFQSSSNCCLKHTLTTSVVVSSSWQKDGPCSSLDIQTARKANSNLPVIEDLRGKQKLPTLNFSRQEKLHQIPSSSQSLISEITLLLHAQEYSKIIDITSNTNLRIEEEADVLFALDFVAGLSYFKLARYDDAKLHLKKCEELSLRLAQQNEEREKEDFQNGNVALCNIYLGDIEFTTESYVNAAQCYCKAIDHYSPKCVASWFKMVPPSLSIIHAKHGSALRSAGKSVDAVKEYNTAITCAKSEKDKLAAHTSLGNLYQSLGENSSALKEYEESIKLAEVLRDHISLGWAHGNMGNAYLGLHRKDEALFHLQKALDLALEHEPTPQAIGRTYNNLGTAYQSMNDLDKAEEYYDLALSQAIYGDDKPGQARVYGNIGNVLMLRKDFERAIPHFSEVLQLTKEKSTCSTACHNKGCALYEWAENQMKSLMFSSPKSKLSSVNNPNHLKVDSDESNPQKTCSDFYIHAPVSSLSEYLPRVVPENIKEYYVNGSKDLEEVVKHHEETFENIKGLSKGFSLSVSLFESNSRTFHRLQDCLVMQGKYDRALLVAEQSRARTLGELMLKKRQWQLELPLYSPLNLEQIISIVKSQTCPIVYLSYTGARLLGWVFVPHDDEVSLGMFEVPLEDDMFDGKSFDYHVKYDLTEKLVERSFEMYQSVKYDEESSTPVLKLHTLIAKPLIEILKQFPSYYCSPILKKLVVIPDSYTSLLPFTCLLSPEGNFLGDQFYFQIMPSLLSMGILSQIPEGTVSLPADSHDFCVIGDPNIPPFYLNGEVWHLGKLPYAKREAEWVAHVLRTAPILKEQATKSTVLLRLMNAKLIHIATHGSASSGFLAFGSNAPHGMSSDIVAVDSSGVLLYPEEVEKLSISPALVVLSSCDSGRGTVKADGIQGMARAFILAGAQSVLTTLWRVPDESASVFMKFFYQYLVDGFDSSVALHKSILSLRCFAKYSQYIHWSGYQLTGRDIRFEIKPTPSIQILEDRLGSKSTFPRLEIVKKIEDALVNGPCLPTDVQILKSGPGLSPSEIVKDFIHFSHDEHFSGGIFWINCRQPDYIDASIKYIEEVTNLDLAHLQISQNQHILLVLDGITELPNSDKLHNVMKNRYVHLVFNYKSNEPHDKLVKEVDRKLIRGCVIHLIEPLSTIETTQRIVYSVMKEHHLAPSNEDQQVFERLSEFTSGSPAIVKITTKILLAKFKEDKQDALMRFSKDVSLELDRKSRLNYPETTHRAKLRSVSKLDIPSVRSAIQDQVDIDIWNTNSDYDSWDSIEELIQSCDFSPKQRLLLNTLCIFSCSPIPYSLVIKLSALITTASQQSHIASTLPAKLQEMCLLKKYPSPVVLHPSLADSKRTTECHEFVYVPQYVSQSIWKAIDEKDHLIALSTVYQALLSLQHVAKPLEACFFSGLCSLLLEAFDFEFQLMGFECYKRVYQLYLEFKQPDFEFLCSSDISENDFPQPQPDILSVKDLSTVEQSIKDVSTKWHELGLELDLERATLNKIKTDNNNKTIATCFAAMLTVWLKRPTPRPTWSALIKALLSPRVNFPKVAQKLSKMICTMFCA